MRTRNTLSENRHKEFITVSPTISGYEHWHDQAAALIRRANPEIGDYQTFIFPIAVNGYLGAPRADAIYIHPDVENYIDYEPDHAKRTHRRLWLRELRMRLNVGARTLFLSITDEAAENFITEQLADLKEPSHT